MEGEEGKDSDDDFNSDGDDEILLSLREQRVSQLKAKQAQRLRIWQRVTAIILRLLRKNSYQLLLKPDTLLSISTIKILKDARSSICI